MPSKCPQLQPIKHLSSTQIQTALHNIISYSTNIWVYIVYRLINARVNNPQSMYIYEDNPGYINAQGILHANNKAIVRQWLYT